MTHPVEIVVQGDLSAVEVLRGMSKVFDDDEYAAIVNYLAEHGPRGPNLYDRFAERANRDALVLGRDLLAQASERI